MQTKDPLRHVLRGLASSNSIRTHMSKFRTWLSYKLLDLGTISKD